MTRTSPDETIRTSSMTWPSNAFCVPVAARWRGSHRATGRLESNRELVPQWSGPIEVLSAVAMPLRDALEAVGASPSADPSDEHLDEAAWLVRANGPFVSYRGRGNGGQLIGTTGYFVIDDATGTVIATGFDIDG